MGAPEVTRRRVLASGLVAVAVAGAGALSWVLNDSRYAPAMTFTTLTGQRIEAEDLRGKVVLVNFWATTCAVCAREMPQIVEAYRSYGPSGLEVVAVAMPYDRPDWVVDYARRKGLPFKVALDYDARLNRAFGGIDATPTSFLIDKRGRIIERILGEPDFARLRATIERELARPAASG
jgi:peroxiredoxin